MSLSRSHSSPVVPPAKAHPLPVPPSKATTSEDESASEQTAAPGADDGAHITPLHLMDQEIAEEADRILQGEQPCEGETPDDLAAVVVADEMEEQFERVEATAEEPQPEPDPQPERPMAVEQQEPAAEEESGSAPVAEVAVVRHPPHETPSANEPAEASPQPAEEQKTLPVVQVRSGALARMMSMVVAAIITLLVVINFPTRIVPESARVIVNWFALSLVLWVPAVWFIALFVVG